jgi:predicted amidohydrolase
MARYVTVGSVSCAPSDPYAELDARLEQAALYATRAARMGADIVVFPEVFPHIGAPRTDWEQVPEEVPGKTTAFMAKVARDNHMYVIWPLYQRSDGLIFNSSVLLGRDGNVEGIYHKMFPTIGEIERGIVPGTEARVFDTDFGRIGMAICFDLNFRPIMEGLAQNGAEIIFFSSMYRGGLQLQAWAHELRLYIVSAIGAELGQIVDMSGKVLGESTYEAVIARRLNLDRRLLHMDLNWDKMDAMLEKYGTDISFEYFTREGKYTVASESDDISVDEMIREFGLEEQPQYFSRAMRVREEALERVRRGKP